MQNIIQKTMEDYNRIAKYFSDSRYDTWSELEQFKKYVKDGQNILDWGCGNGRLLFLFKGEKIKYFGIDNSIELLKIARKKFGKEVKEGRAKFYCTAKKAKKFPDGFFDLVFMIASLHHLPDEKTRLELLEKTYREMKEGAMLIITVWNLKSDWATEKIKKDWKIIGENDFLIPWKDEKSRVLVERDYHDFSEGELIDLLKKAGFKIIKLDFYSKSNWTDKKGGRNLIAIVKK